MNRYQEITPISRKEAEAIIKQGTPDLISLTLIRLAYHEPDWRWVEELCISQSEHQDKWVRRACATCFGHIARIHGKIDKKKVLPILSRLLQDPEVKGHAEDTMEDFKVFLRGDACD